VGERVLVIGGTRGTGYLIVNRLQQEGYQVRVLARNEVQAREKLGPAVEIVEGDITKPETLPGALKGMDHMIFTAGVTQRPAGEAVMKATNFDGIRNTLAAARASGFAGRFLYMTTIGVTKSSLAGTILNLVKRNTMKWRKLAEDEIRNSGFDYTIIRAGVLTDSPGGQRAVEVGQKEYPLAFQYKISRADVAEVFVQALRHPSTRRTTFDVVWAREPQRPEWDALFSELRPDG
jgi:uncharacterized protein YbjT (DUF2867 family)